MANRLEPIILEKQHEVAALKKLIAGDPTHPIALILSGKTKRTAVKSFKNALSHHTLAVIAEIKRKSPSKGDLATIVDPLKLAQQYVRGGAQALSILTDKKFFNGQLSDLTSVATALQHHPIPVLRKDFIIDEIQIAESIVAGADAILAIVAVLGEQTQFIIEKAHAFGIDVLVEVHNEQELAIALAAKANIIGINNRDLTTFEVDIEQALTIGAQIPAHIIKIAESGINDPAIAQRYYHAGFNAVLIGEALVKSSHPEQFIQECCHA